MSQAPDQRGDPDRAAQCARRPAHRARGGTAGLPARPGLTRHRAGARHPAAREVPAWAGRGGPGPARAPARGPREVQPGPGHVLHRPAWSRPPRRWWPGTAGPVRVRRGAGRPVLRHRRRPGRPGRGASGPGRGPGPAAPADGHAERGRVRGGRRRAATLADVREADLAGVDAVFIDPARRTDKRRLGPVRRAAPGLVPGPGGARRRGGHQGRAGNRAGHGARGLGTGVRRGRAGPEGGGGLVTVARGRGHPGHHPPGGHTLLPEPGPPVPVAAPGPFLSTRARR